MKKITFLLAMLVSFSWQAMAQISSYYTFSESTGTYTEITGGSTSGLGNSDDGEVTAIPIGFSFDYVGTPYTTVTIDANGAISFTASSVTFSNNLSATSSSAVNVIAPLWDDLYHRTADTAEIRYETAGTAPNRTFTVQYKNLSWRNAGQTVNFQLVLSETSNNIQFNYGQNNSTDSRTASIGFNRTSGSDFISVTPGTPATASTSSDNNSISSTDYPGDGVSYLFTYSAPSCPDPSALSVSSLTSVSADLAWTEVGTATTWDIEWDTAGFTQGAGTMVTGTTTNPHSISGLTANTSYEFYVRADCGGTTSGWTGPYTFTTLCSVYTAPYSEPFNSFLPSACWDQAGSGTPSTGPGGLGSSSWGQSGFPGNGTGGARVNLYSSFKEEWILSPQFDLSSGGPYEVRVENMITAYSGTGPSPMGSDDSVQVLISTDGGTTWAAIHTWDAANPAGNSAVWTTLDLTAYSSATTQFAIWGSEGAVSDPEDYYFYVGGFELRAIPTCIQPESLMVSNLTTVGADLYWTEMATASTWDVEIVTTGTTPTGIPTNAGLTLDSVTITGLSASTTYDYYVRSYCSAIDQSYWTGPVTFTTACAAVSAFSQNFDGVSSPNMPNCWGNLYFSSSTFANVQTNNSTSNANSGSNSVRFYNSSDLNPTWMLVSPELTNLSAGTHQTVFYAKDSDSNPIIVGTMSDPLDTATFTAFDTISTSSTYQEYIVSFASYSGTDNYIAYRSVPSGTYDYTYMDDISWETLPSCPKPSNLMVTAITNNSASLGWVENGGATAWEIEWDTLGFIPGSGTTVSSSTNPYVLGSLNANTSYEFYVKSICGAGDSSLWVGPYAFNTSCNAVSSYPYSENFDGSLNNGVWNCWSVVNNDNDNYTWSQSNTYISPTHSAPYAAHGMGNNDDYLITPQFIIGANPIQVRFWDIVESASRNNTYTVKVSTTGTNPSDFTDSITTIDCSNTSWLEHTIDLSAYTNQNIYVAFHQTYSGATFYGFGIDDFTAELVPLTAGTTVDNDVTCVGGADGSATASALYGTAPYTYIWNNGATTATTTGLSVGTYTVTITDQNADTSSAMVVIADGTPVLVDLGNDTSVCVNATLTLDAGSFTSYLWDDASTMQTRATVNTSAGSTNYSVTVTDANSCTGVDTIEVTVLADPIVDLGNDTSICDGSMLTLDAGSFSSYVWDDASTTQTRMVTSTLGATTYSVTVTNVAGCSGSDDIIVTGYAPVMVNLGNDTSVCDAVSLTLDAGTYTSYLWDDASTAQTRMTVSTVGAVDYSVEVTDANGCTGNDTITVTGFAMPVVDLGNDTSLCDGETITLDAGAFTSYLWDDASTMQTRMTVSTLGAVAYSVEITDANGCMAADTVEVTGMAPVMVDLGSDTSLCNGAPYTLDAGAGFASYFWNNGFNTQTLDVSSTTAGTMTYSVRVEDAAGCSGRDTAIISVKAPVLVDLGADTNIWAEGVDTHTLDAGSGFASYLWSDNVTTTQTYEVRRATEGLVSVIVEDADGCEGTDTVRVTFAPVGVEEFTASTLTMYPNPAVDQVTVELSNLDNVSNVNVTFLSVTGQVVLAKNIVVKGANSVETFDVSSLATGTYLVQFEANGNVVTKQFVIK